MFHSKFQPLPVFGLCSLLLGLSACGSDEIASGLSTTGSKSTVESSSTSQDGSTAIPDKSSGNSSSAGVKSNAKDSSNGMDESKGSASSSASSSTESTPSQDSQDGSSTGETTPSDPSSEDSSGEPGLIDCSKLVFSGFNEGEVPESVALANSKGEMVELRDHCNETVLVMTGVPN